jgi:hypothetical protein
MMGEAVAVVLRRCARGALRVAEGRVTLIGRNP